VSVAPIRADTAHDLKNHLFELELHWVSPCPNCLHDGSARTHRARVDAKERLVVGGWFDPARRWPIPVPTWLEHLVTDTVPGVVR